MSDLIEIYSKLKKEYPNLDTDLVKYFIDEMKEEACLVLMDYEHKKEYGCHIGYAELYDKAVNLLDWADDKGSGEKWTVEEIANRSGIDFDTKDYYKYDYAYVVNMLYSDYCNIFTDSGIYLKMAKNYLEDPDYMGDPSERAYHNAKKRIKYFTK